MSNKLITGNDAIVAGALDAGAEIMFGYPITPASEILHNWVKECGKNKKIQCLQTEDEIAAGFAVLGAVLGGKKAFTASAGPGHILLQDALAMAENLRLPFVGIMMQRGGPSTGTVSFGQQEVNLAIHGGNGDGLRIVYSASSILELYTLTIKAFDSAWRYRFPTIMLGDGYLGKMATTLDLPKPLHPVIAKPILPGRTTPVFLRNCYSNETELNGHLNNNIRDWRDNFARMAESEIYGVKTPKVLIIAHGIVAAAAKDAIDVLRKEKVSLGLFRPITLNPFDHPSLLRAVKNATRVLIFESSLDQLSYIVKYNLSGSKIRIIENAKPALAFTAGEIVTTVRKEIND